VEEEERRRNEVRLEEGGAAGGVEVRLNTKQTEKVLNEEWVRVRKMGEVDK